MNNTPTTFVHKLMDIYSLSLDLCQYSDTADERISFRDILKMYNIKYIVYDYSYDGNEERINLVIVYKKDTFKLWVKKVHKNNDISWEILE